ncbi:Uncharacterised protein [Mycobacteroides abscessus subsp. abscessus]|uniref:hypothetical protein n=1 Tax=Mycobacteroides abscessus TaxID=36809 RepID=UPI000928BBEB|nr:hypothetical protein [Mycobacteroides abscessus]SHS19095.1 Uncharacterised protein [Mycobacteroides abscessus subsp. abscessus]
MTDGDPWNSLPPMNSSASKTFTRAEAIRHEVFMQTEPEVLYAGGFDAVRADQNHRLHEIYDDLDSLEREYESLVALVSSLLRDEHFEQRPRYGLRTTHQADCLIEDLRRGMERSVLSKYDDPNYRYDAPDEIDTYVYRHTPEQALRSNVLSHIAGDIEAAGGFPGLARNPNHRRHNSPAGIDRIRRQYDEIVKRVEPQLDRTDYRQGPSWEGGDDFGWSLNRRALELVESTVKEVQEEFRAHKADAALTAQQVRRNLQALRLGMRSDEYVQALTGSTGAGTCLQQAARNEIARRETLTRGERQMETQARTSRQEQGREQRGPELSL